MKKCLFICPSFYGYYNDIIHSLNKKGYSVDYFDDKYNYTEKDLILNKLVRTRSIKLQESYFQNIFNLTLTNNYDFLLVINAKLMSKEWIRKIKLYHQGIKCVFYAWDSVSSFKNILEIKEEFDYFYSFDKKDCDLFGFEFLPLFYTNTIYDSEKIYDYCSVMNFYPSKAEQYLRVIRAIPQNGLKYKIHLRMKSKLQYLYFKIKYNSLRNFKLNDFSYRNLSRRETYDLFSKSKVVLDIPLNTQNGLTMRTFEAISMRCKLITTNVNIKEYDFFNEDNIFVIEEGVMVPDDFFLRPFNDKYLISSKYHIDSFVDILLSNVK